MKADRQLLERVCDDLLIIIKQLGYDTGKIEFNINSKTKRVKPLLRREIHEQGRVIEIREDIL